MTVTLKRGLCVWAALLTLLLLFVFPLDAWQRGGAVLAITLAVRLAWRWAGQSLSALDSAIPLPAADFRQPLVLVCGDGLPGLFDGSAEGAVLRTTSQGCYLRVEGLEWLPLRVGSVLAHRPHWVGQLAVLLVINPNEHDDASALEGRIQAFRHQLALARRQGAALPLLQVTYLQRHQTDTPWFCWTSGAQQPDVLEAGARISLGGWQRRREDLPLSAARLRTSVVLDSAAGWLNRHVLARFANRGEPAVVAHGVMLVPALPRSLPGNLWQQWLHDRTALREIDVPAASTKLPLPDALLPLLPIQVRSSPLRRAGAIALWLSTVAILVAMVGSTWQNSQLVRRVSDDLQRYLAIPYVASRNQPEFALREAAMSVLRADAVRLDGYYRYGEPLWLGMGLYQGERLRRELLAAITGHRLPPDAPAQATDLPEPLRLDSLSLFNVGSATLRPESTKLLINALVGIRAQPGWLIVIAGHTDATGSAEQNLQLSRARASAVRDWMQRMGDIPDSCFAVQGFGASQPIASNDTEIGRATNRRVDIRLVPEVGACALPTAAPDGKHQSHAAAVNL
ncbi:OmpA family protein [Pseudomonas sp. BN415]|uniref:OmpA family protein n=1 Tax=Pseudomonas sp. BN415 TaxID=2567889 RepID=UPI00245832B9|nr:OmpA family protein [Pseudomonas sp. BN415]MDH4581504.1 OmpA family protein [Pseudomonas sp. BN415]